MRSSPRTVWITGASSGIGVSLAKEFAANGDLVVLSARSLRLLKAVRKGIRRQGGLCEISALDVRNSSSVEKTGRKIIKAHGTIDILVNNAGVTSYRDFLGTTVKEFDTVIDTNLRGSFVAARTVVPAMIRAGRGMIVNVLSFAAKVVYTKSAAYTASKSGTEALMNVLRAEVRDKGIKVVNVYPGAVLTRMWLSRHRKKYSHRMLLPRDVAKLVYGLTVHPPSVMVEEVIIRPQGGDLTV